jgi:hypothetical protein
MNVVYAKDGLRVQMTDGTVRRFPPGSHWPADDPFVRANPGQFSADPRYHLAFTDPRPEYFGDVAEETATAGPGERRNVRRAS